MIQQLPAIPFRLAAIQPAQMVDHANVPSYPKAHLVSGQGDYLCVYLMDQTGPLPAVNTIYDIVDHGRKSVTLQPDKGGVALRGMLINSSPRP